jgi:hypothetical protein
LTGVLEIVVTCTKRKTRPVPPALKLRSFPPAALDRRACAWMEALRSASTERVPAAAMYSGDHWSVVRSLPSVAAAVGWRARLWVCSAGYGLIPLEAPIRAYSATFAPSHPDCVFRSVRDDALNRLPAAWWRLLAGWEGPQSGAPRTLAELGWTSPRSVVWVIASALYLRAIADDVRSLASGATSSGRLCIFSAGTAGMPGLTDHLVPCDARLQSLVGGALRSLNVRVARMALRDLATTGARLGGLSERFSRLLAELKPLVGPERAPLNDEEVKEFILGWLQEDPAGRPTPLLRRLRDRGYACEYRRFTSLYRQVQEQFHGRQPSP